MAVARTKFRPFSIMALQWICNPLMAVRFCQGAPIYSEIAQSVEQRTVNPQVPGSSPGFGAK